MRLADDTPIDDTIEVMMKHWHMTGANLVITVIGGAKNFNLDGKKKEVFNRGLVTVSSPAGTCSCSYCNCFYYVYFL